MSSPHLNLHWRFQSNVAIVCVTQFQAIFRLSRLIHDREWFHVMCCWSLGLLTKFHNRYTNPDRSDTQKLSNVIQTDWSNVRAQVVSCEFDAHWTGLSVSHAGCIADVSSHFQSESTTLTILEYQPDQEEIQH